MAPAPEGKPARKGFNLSDPGVKEYLIVGGVAVAAFLVWQWWKNNHPSPAASTAGPSSGGGRPPSSPSGLSTSQFMAWIRDHQSSPPVEPPEDEPAAKQPPVPGRPNHPLPPHDKRGV